MEDTHPWICFRLDLGRIEAPTWLALGQCVSKIEHMMGTPLMPSVAEEMRRTLISRGIQGTAAIEGNTLDVEQVRRRIDDDLELPESQEYLGVEIDNLMAAYGLIPEVIVADAPDPFTEERICEYNRVVLEGLELDPGVVPGEYSSKQHGVGNYRAPSPTRIRELMPEFVEWLNDGAAWEPPPNVPPLAVTILKAVTAHLYLAWIHPFGDGNGRTARLLEAEVLARGGVPGLSYHLLADHYNRTRVRYYQRLAATSRDDKGEPHVFIEYAIQGYADGLRAQIRRIKTQHREVVWRDYVHDLFRGDDRKVALRQRRLAMDLAEMQEPVEKGDLRRISQRVNESYHGLGPKAVSRDVSALMKLGLIEKTPDGFVAALHTLNAFVPAWRDDSIEAK